MQAYIRYQKVKFTSPKDKPQPFVTWALVFSSLGVEENTSPLMSCHSRGLKNGDSPAIGLHAKPQLRDPEAKETFWIYGSREKPSVSRPLPTPE